MATKDFVKDEWVYVVDKAGGIQRKKIAKVFDTGYVALFNDDDTAPLAPVSKDKVFRKLKSALNHLLQMTDETIQACKDAKKTINKALKMKHTETICSILFVKNDDKTKNKKVVKVNKIKSTIVKN